MDYSKLFKDRILVISGVSRSGTSILGKIVGSMRNAHYLFEPVIMQSGFRRELIEDGTFFEDYVFPIIQNRHVNINGQDQSWSGNYFQLKDPPLTREDTLDYIEREKPWLVIKANELQTGYDDLRNEFPGCTIIEIYRNGNDIISSSMGRGWYTDNWCENDMLFGVWLDKAWPEYTPITRCAYVWRHLIEQNGFDCLIRYEYLIEDPLRTIECLLGTASLQMTDKTQHHIESIRNHKPTKHPAIWENIQEPEKSKFVKTMKQLGYM